MSQNFLKIVSLIMVVGSILFFQNCGLVVRPQATNLSSFSSQMFHDNFDAATMQCMACHESDRKNAQHYTGQDCVGCHVPGVGWAVGSNVAHSPVPTRCNSCHADGAQYDKFPPTHIAIGLGDCIDCHKATIGAGFVDWKGGLFAHDATLIAGKNCNSCHEAKRPPVVTLTNINPSINDARVVDKSHFASKDCYVCHNAPPTGNSWRGASVGQYEHTNASGVNLNLCLSCHMRDSHVGQDGSVANDIVGDGKCQQCHTQRRSWRDTPRNPNL